MQPHAFGGWNHDRNAGGQLVRSSICTTGCHKVRSTITSTCSVNPTSITRAIGEYAQFCIAGAKPVAVTGRQPLDEILLALAIDAMELDAGGKLLWSRASWTSIASDERHP